MLHSLQQNYPNDRFAWHIYDFLFIPVPPSLKADKLCMSAFSYEDRPSSYLNSSPLPSAMGLLPSPYGSPPAGASRSLITQ